MELERAVGRLEEGLSTVKADIAGIKSDVKVILEFRWKIFGATAVIAVAASALGQLALVYLRGLPN